MTETCIKNHWLASKKLSIFGIITGAAWKPPQSLLCMLLSAEQQAPMMPKSHQTNPLTFKFGISQPHELFNAEALTIAIRHAARNYSRGGLGGGAALFYVNIIFFI